MTSSLAPTNSCPSPSAPEHDVELGMAAQSSSCPSFSCQPMAATCKMADGGHGKQSYCEVIGEIYIPS